MTYETLLNHINKRLTIRQIAELENTSFSNVRYWLRVRGLKTKRGPSGKGLEPATRRCSCGEVEPSKFYGHKVSACIKCHNEKAIFLSQDKRKRALALLGGACVECGYREFDCSLDVHHLDSNIKDTAFNSWRHWKWERIEKELQQCVLLCKNCHAALHSGRFKLRSMAQR